MTIPKPLRKPLISFGVILAMVPIGEVLVRVLTNTHPPLVMRDPVIGRRFAPSFEGLVFDPESQREILVRTNRDGFRGPDRQHQATPETRRIAVLGDSMVAGLSVEENVTFCAQLEELLGAAHPELEWEVMNFGVLGSSTGQEYLTYETVVRDYAPDLVLGFFYSGNDLADNSRELTSSPRIYFELDEQGGLVQLPHSSTRSRSSRWLNLNSRLYVWQKQMLRRSDLREAMAGPRVRASDWSYCMDPPESVERAWAITTALIERLHDTVEADGSRFVFVHLPGGKQLFTDLFEGVVVRTGEDPSRFDRLHPERKLEQICKEIDSPWISLTPALERATPTHLMSAEEEWVFYEGAGHFNERGHRIAAEALFESLSKGNSEQASLLQELVDQSRASSSSSTSSPR